MSASPTLALSPSFGRARTLSRIMTVLFAIAFLVMLSTAVSAPVMVIFPKSPGGADLGIGLGNGVGVNFGALHGWPAINAMLTVELFCLPSVLMLYHILKLFFCFTRGEVFANNPIAHIRAAGLWLTASFFTSIAAVFLLDLFGVNHGGRFHFPGALPALVLWFSGKLFAGIATTIAAYVMAEARRIADENASIL